VQNGFLVNGAGYYLMGLPIDPKTHNPIGSMPTVLQFQNSFIPAQPTSLINYGANLPTDPITANTNASVPGSDLLNPAYFISNPLAISPQAPTMTGIGAALTPDAPASNLTINGVTIPLSAGQTASNIAAAITGSTAGVSATIDGTTHETVLTSADAATAIDIQSASTGSIDEPRAERRHDRSDQPHHAACGCIWPDANCSIRQ
jgi:flagellar hook protein FlgE